MNGQEAVQWRLKEKQEAGEKLNEYYFYVTPEVRLRMKGHSW